MAYRYLKGTDIKYELKHYHGVHPTDAMMYEAQKAVAQVMARHIKRGSLPKVARWSWEDRDLAKRFGGKVLMPKCSRCGKVIKDWSEELEALKAGGWWHCKEHRA